MPTLKLERTYTITLRPEPEGGFTVRVPALPEIVTYGDDMKEALAMAKDAIEIVLLSRREREEYVPTTTWRRYEHRSYLSCPARLLYSRSAARGFSEWQIEAHRRAREWDEAVMFVEGNRGIVLGVHHNCKGGDLRP